MSLNIATHADFKKEVSEHKGHVLVDFWAEWCQPCKQITPIIEEISEELKDKLKVCKINIDENPETPTEQKVRGIPTLMIFKDGKIIATKVGSLPKSSLIDWIHSTIGA